MNIISEHQITVDGIGHCYSRRKVYILAWSLLLGPFLVGEMISCLHYSKHVTESFAKMYKKNVTDPEFNTWLSRLNGFGALYSVGGFFGSLTALVLLKLVGCRISAITFTYTTLIGSVFRLVCVYSDLSVLYVARFLDGYGTAALVTIIGAWLPQLVNKRYRPYIGYLTHIMVALGFILSAVLMISKIAGKHWNYTAFAPIGICVLLLIFLHLLPESPMYIYEKTRSCTELVHALCMVTRDNCEIEEKKKEIIDEVEKSAASRPLSYYQCYNEPGSPTICNRKLRIATAFLLHYTHQMSGFVTVIAAAGDIISIVRSKNPDTLSIIAFGLLIAGTLLFAWIPDRIPKKPFIIIGHVGIVASTLVFILLHANKEIMKVLAFCFIPFCSMFGPGSFVGGVVSNMFTRSEAPSAELIIQLGKWTGNFTALFIIPYVLRELKEKMMYVNLGCSGLIIVYLIILEIIGARNALDNVRDSSM